METGPSTPLRDRDKETRNKGLKTGERRQETGIKIFFSCHWLLIIACPVGSEATVRGVTCLLSLPASRSPDLSGVGWVTRY